MCFCTCRARTCPRSCLLALGTCPGNGFVSAQARTCSSSYMLALVHAQVCIRLCSYPPLLVPTHALTRPRLYLLELVPVLVPAPARTPHACTRSSLYPCLYLPALVPVLVPAPARTCLRSYPLELVPMLVPAAHTHPRSYLLKLVLARACTSSYPCSYLLLVPTVLCLLSSYLLELVSGLPLVPCLGSSFVPARPRSYLPVHVLAPLVRPCLCAFDLGSCSFDHGLCSFAVAQPRLSLPAFTS